MINSIQKQNNLMSFRSMYGVGQDWNKAFSPEKEKEFLVNLLEKIKSKKVKYTKNDGIVYQFEMPKEDLFFVKEKEHIMANIKCVSKGNENIGHYIINDSTDSNIKSVFNIISNALSAISGKHRAVSDVLRNTSKRNRPMINFK